MTILIRYRMYNIKWQQQHQGNGRKHVCWFLYKNHENKLWKNIYEILYYVEYTISYIRYKHIYNISQELWEYSRFLSFTVFRFCFTVFTGAWPIEPSSPLPLQQTLSIWVNHDDVIKWKHFPRYWPFVRGILRWIPLIKDSCAGLWCFLWSAPEQ